MKERHNYLFGGIVFALALIAGILLRINTHLSRMAIAYERGITIYEEQLELLEAQIPAPPSNEPGPQTGKRVR